jgi:hypothetical protein
MLSERESRNRQKGANTIQHYGSYRPLADNAIKDKILPHMIKPLNIKKQNATLRNNSVALRGLSSLRNEDNNVKTSWQQLRSDKI